MVWALGEQQLRGLGRGSGGEGLRPRGPAWRSSCCASCPRLLLCPSSASSCCAVLWRGPRGLRSWLCGEKMVRACSPGGGGRAPGPCSTCRSAMEVFSLNSRAQAVELVLMLCSCSLMAGRRAPARSRSSKSRTTQWSHTASQGEGHGVSAVRTVSEEL